MQNLFAITLTPQQDLFVVLYGLGEIEIKEEDKDDYMEFSFSSSLSRSSLSFEYKQKDAGSVGDGADDNKQVG